MFANTQMFAMDFGFPDVCKTPVGPVITPLPYPNFSFTSTAIPNVFNQFITAMPIHNLLTTKPTSTGNEAGVLLGVVSNLIKGPVQHVLGSVKVFRSVMPATKMLSMSIHNGVLSNIVGITLTPCQIKVMYLS